MEQSYINTIEGRMRYCEAIDFVCNHCNYSNEETCESCPITKTFRERFPFEYHG